MAQVHGLPAGIQVFERGWLSSNNVLLVGEEGTALIDTGYGTHAAQTVALVGHALDGRPLDQVINTHLHSDHCGGNAALQAIYPGLQTWIPPGLADAVRRWDSAALTYVPTGQVCERFRFDGLLEPGRSLELAGQCWEVHAAPGHDPHSIILFRPDAGVLMSADALWENGFGVVFPELEGVAAFEEVGATLDLIERLAPRCVIPGHGAPFRDLGGALDRARSRLAGLRRDPARHGRHAAKVLLKFKLLELQEVEEARLLVWARSTGYFELVQLRHFSGENAAEWLVQLVDELVASGAARREAGRVFNA